jgi:hypothetical protein
LKRLDEKNLKEENNRRMIHRSREEEKKKKREKKNVSTIISLSLSLLRSHYRSSSLVSL